MCVTFLHKKIIQFFDYTTIHEILY